MLWYIILVTVSKLWKIEHQETLQFLISLRYILFKSRCPNICKVHHTYSYMFQVQSCTADEFLNHVLEPIPYIFTRAISISLNGNIDIHCVFWGECERVLSVTLFKLRTFHVHPSQCSLKWFNCFLRINKTFN